VPALLLPLANASAEAVNKASKIDTVLFILSFFHINQREKHTRVVYYSAPYLYTCQEKITKM
jgi:hypothetical protein